MLGLIPYGRGENSLWNYFDSFEKNFFGDTAGAASSFRTDIIDNGDAFLLKAELPGMKKEDIKIDLDGDRLTISAQHSEESEDKKENYIRRERRFGSFSRSFDTANIQTDAITAAYKDGILTLSLPKKPEIAPESRQISIEG